MQTTEIVQRGIDYIEEHPPISSRLDQFYILEISIDEDNIEAYIPYV